MSTINLKPDKVRTRCGVLTLDQCHTNKIESFQRERELLPAKKNKLEVYKQILANIEKKDPKKLTDEDIKTKSKSKTIIEDLSYQIQKIEGGTEEMEYFSESVDILVEYYADTTLNDETTNQEQYEYNMSNYSFDTDTNKIKIDNKFKEVNFSPMIQDLSSLLTKTNIQTNNLQINKKVDKLKLLNQQSMNKQKVAKVTKHRINKPSNASNILASLGIANKEEGNNNSDEIENLNPNPYTTSLSNKKNSAVLFDHYRYITDPMYINENNKKNKNMIVTCPECNIEKRHNHIEGTLICKICGDMSKILIEAEKINSKDKSNEKTTYPYKKINHLNEWLNQIQAKQTTDIPDFVFNDIKNELKKNRENDLNKLTPKRICEILKKLKLTHYKEHHIYILCQISGQKPPVLSREQEETIREMFRDIQKPYEKYKPKKRINFSSYSFIIYKICELLELDHITRMLFLLKSKEKLRDLDNIWKKICYDLRWEYIASTN